MIPYLIFLLYILGIGSALATGFTLYEEGLSLTFIIYLLGAVFMLGLATIGTINILIGAIG